MESVWTFEKLHIVEAMRIYVHISICEFLFRLLYWVSYILIIEAKSCRVNYSVYALLSKNA